jgi:hypothetical protein
MDAKVGHSLCKHAAAEYGVHAWFVQGHQIQGDHALVPVVYLINYIYGSAVAEGLETNNTVTKMTNYLCQTRSY